MKVICIDAKPHGTSPYEDSLVKLKEGDVYTVIGYVYTPNSGYRLSEVKSSSPSGAYKVERFIPLSSIDETTFERNYKTETCPA